MLSATIEGAPEFAQWIAKIKERNIMLIPTDHRVVPLNHYILNYDEMLYEYKSILERKRRKKDIEEEASEAGASEAGEELLLNIKEAKWANMIMDEKNNIINVAKIRKSYKIYDLKDMMNVIINQLHLYQMTPALFFVFSRNMCEKLSSNINVNLIDHKTRSLIIDTFNKYMLPYKDIYEQLVVALGNLPSDKIKIIAKFIKSHQKYYYPLTQIYNEIKQKRIIDCSSSIFLSKCHLLFLENYISMVSFINDFRKFI
jgi:superfamily II RNA helicase